MTNFYSASPVCTPSHAALLTGRFPPRTRTDRHVFFNDYHWVGFVTFVDDFDQFSQEFRLLSPADDRFNYVAGLYYLDREVVTDTVSDLSGIGLGAFLGDFTEQSQFWSIYGQINYTFSDAFSVTGSLRHTDEEKEGDAVRDRSRPPLLPGWLTTPLSDEISDSQTDGSVSFQWTPKDVAMMYASYTQGSKSGGFTGAGTIATLDIFTLQPESSESIEIGVKLTLLDGALFVGAAYFTTDYEDLQVSQRPEGSFIFTHAAKAEVDGFEVDAIWALNDNWKLSCSL